MVGIHSDITEQKEAEERLRAYQDRLRALAGELTATEVGVLNANNFSRSNRALALPIRSGENAF